MNSLLKVRSTIRLDHPIRTFDSDGHERLKVPAGAHIKPWPGSPKCVTISGKGKTVLIEADILLSFGRFSRFIRAKDVLNS
jgi:hypothetical protein